MPDFVTGLPVGTYVGDFRIDQVLDQGGFGIVYLAYDTVLQVSRALKEYMPSQVAARVPGSKTVSAVSHKEKNLYQEGLRQFVEEARHLASLNHPNVVRVLRFIEENGTAISASSKEQHPPLQETTEIRR